MRHGDEEIDIGNSILVGSSMTMSPAALRNHVYSHCAMNLNKGEQYKEKAPNLKDNELTVAGSGADQSRNDDSGGSPDVNDSNTVNEVKRKKYPDGELWILLFKHIVELFRLLFCESEDYEVKSEDWGITIYLSIGLLFGCLILIVMLMASYIKI
ncbi:uncharacterized protein L201_004788 [Kwoniella dendrophila CBS 6074]|uniref:Uncharacterized protein n=1 Tax=Kwoniella dendrophila CBS 6074 TaxID=1295534 RepID=A0AAX4JWN0_9TREE